ncbi:odorant receptor 49b-like isoform X2 [Athalia rosae]|uniref:odorant receptor 49b-like isoform X2 n=1 Tax=Athalia rosae TaxID=37344 RepID=UPI0020339F00|nr:odorant receptor 49b-like isoform X2 [Athalia rosae]
MWLPPAFPRSDLRALKYILYFLSFAGLFALSPEGRTSKIYNLFYNGYFISVMSCVGLVTVLTAFDLYDHLNDVDVLADHGVIFTALVLIMIKQITVVRNGRRIEYWVGVVQRRFREGGDPERARLAKNDKETFFYIKMFSYFWFLITVSYLLPLYFEEPDEFHLPTVSSRLFGVDTVAEYALVYTWNTVALSLAVLGVFAIDLFIVGMYVEAASRLESIGDAFEKIADLENEQFGNEDTPERVDDFSTRTTNFSSIRRRVAKSVAEHNEIIKFIEELNDVFYWTLLFQSVFVGVIVAGCGFYGFVSFLHGNTSSFFRSMMYISGAICETWLCCTFGDRIKCSSANVATAMWNSHWYTLAVEDQRSVLLIMQASKNPLHMAAGKLFRMDLERLGFVLSSAYSYFTVLRNIYK